MVNKIWLMVGVGGKNKSDGDWWWMLVNKIWVVVGDGE